MDKNKAVDEAVSMMTIPMGKLPKGATEYLNDLSKRVGICMEVCITAYAYYNQAVLGMPCEDDLYIIPEIERKWFITNGYINE